MRIAKWILPALVLIPAVVLGVGMYKFNVLQDDIYMTGGAITEADVIGGWTKPTEGMPDQTEGFELRPGGAANSINMATLPYTSWKLEKDKLILTGTSVGNGSSSPVTDVFTITSIGKPRMYVTDAQGREVIYDKRQLSEQPAP